MIEDKKKCSKCYEVLLEHNSIHRKGKLYSICKPCKNKCDREYSKKNKDKILARVKVWYRENKNHVLEYQKERRKRSEVKKRKLELLHISKQNNPEYWRYKKKRDKHSRRIREADLIPLTKEVILKLEEYNISKFNTSSFVCEYCLSTIDGSYHLDHILPIKLGGNNSLNNLAISCSKCNLCKGSKLLIDYLPEKIEYFGARKLC